MIFKRILSVVCATLFFGHKRATEDENVRQRMETGRQFITESRTLSQIGPYRSE